MNWLDLLLDLLRAVMVVGLGAWAVWLWRAPVVKTFRRAYAPALIAAGVTAFVASGLLWLFYWAPVGSSTAVPPSPVEALLARLQPASVAFFVPSPIMRDEPVDATLDIGPPRIDPYELEKRLQEIAGRSGVGAFATVNISTRMVASLTPDRDCKIVSKQPLDQVLRLDGTMRWAWIVTPKESGDLKLTVALSAPIDVGGHESSYVITTYEKTVTVAVAGADQAKDWLTWITDHWVVLGAAGGGLLAIGGWLRTRRKRGAGYRPG